MPEENNDLFNFEGVEETPVESQDENYEFLNNDEDTPPVDENEFSNTGDNEPHDEDQPPVNYIERLLKERGINKDSISVVDEEGNTSEIKWDDLTDDEKFDILNEKAEESALPTDEELKVLNFLRSNNMTLQDFAEWQKQVGVDEYLASQQQSFEIDSYSDDEVIAYDFIQRFGEEMSDEEIDAEIERLKSDPDAYKKRVELLRNSYKSEAEAQAKLYQEQEASKAQADTEAFQNAYTSAMNNMSYIHGVDLDENDKTELWDFVMNKDAANRTGLSKAMDDPTNVLKMAWYLLHGEEVYDQTVDYFKKEIAKRTKQQSTPPSQPRSVRRPAKSSEPTDAFKFN